MASESTSTVKPRCWASAAVARTQLLVMYPATVTVSTPCSRSRSASPVPGKALASRLVIESHDGSRRSSMSGCSSHPRDPAANTGTPSGDSCRTMTTGSLLWVASRTSVMHASDCSTGGYWMASGPSKYSC